MQHMVFRLVRLLFEGGLYAMLWVCKTRESGLARCDLYSESETKLCECHKIATTFKQSSSTTSSHSATPSTRTVQRSPTTFGRWRTTTWTLPSSGRSTRNLQLTTMQWRDATFVWLKSLPLSWLIRARPLRGAWRDHCFPEPFSCFLHKTGLENLKITSARCFLLKCQRKDSKKAKEHWQFRGVLGRWCTAAIDHTTFHACQRCRKTAILQFFSRLWVSFFEEKPFLTSNASF